jgi:hypothetical protein
MKPEELAKFGLASSLGDRRRGAVVNVPASPPAR